MKRGALHLPPFHPAPGINEKVREIVGLCVERIASSATLHPLSLVLTGSFSRGEGTVVQRGGTTQFLSDVEFLVAVDDSRRFSQRHAELKALEHAIAQELRHKGVDCTVEFTLAVRRFFRTARPSIFAFELRTHGKVVYGYEGILDEMPCFTAEDIPQLDAFYLLNNRIIEQLSAYYRLGNAAYADVGFMYGLLKFYIDLATSVLIFLGGYASTYEERKRRFYAAARTLDVPEALALGEKVDYWTTMKTAPQAELFFATSRDDALKQWRELAGFVSSLWRWELNILEGSPHGERNLRESRFVRDIAVYALVRQWIKIAYLAAVKGSLKDIARARLLYGNPRHMLYTEAARHYFNLAGGNDENPQGCSGANGAGPLQLFPFRMPLTGGGKRTQEIVRVWQNYFRNF